MPASPSLFPSNSAVSSEVQMDQVVKVGPFGGSGGEPFDMGAADRLLQIKIRYGAAINGMTITNRVKGSDEIKKFKFGGGGDKEDTIDFKENEFLTGISGYVGQLGGLIVVRSLSFGTNLRTFGPYGPEVGTPFLVPVAKGEIVGFFGRSGTLVDAIGVYIVPNVDASGVSSKPN